MVIHYLENFGRQNSALSVLQVRNSAKSHIKQCLLENQTKLVESLRAGRPYKEVRHKLTLHNDVICNGDLIVPLPTVKRTLSKAYIIIFIVE